MAFLERYGCNFHDHILIRVFPWFYTHIPPTMFSLLLRLMHRFERFQAWFDHRFGWFFTNGMKERRPQRSGVFRG